MQNFGNHMEVRTSNKHTSSECRNRSETGQRTKKIRHNGTKLQIHDMTRNKQLKGVIRYLQYFCNFA